MPQGPQHRYGQALRFALGSAIGLALDPALGIALVVRAAMGLAEEVLDPVSLAVHPDLISLVFHGQCVSRSSAQRLRYREASRSFDDATVNARASQRSSVAMSVHARICRR